MENAEKKEPVSIAIASLEKTKREVEEQYRRDIAELDRVIDNIKKLPAKKKAMGAMKTNGKNGKMVFAGRWRGMSITDSVQAFLSNFDDPVPFDTLMTALRAGGVEMGDSTKPNRYAANVKTTVVNNPKKFRYNRKKDTVELVVGAAAAG